MRTLSGLKVEEKITLLDGKTTLRMKLAKTKKKRFFCATVKQKKPKRAQFFCGVSKFERELMAIKRRIGEEENAKKYDKIIERE